MMEMKNLTYFGFLILGVAIGSIFGSHAHRSLPTLTDSRPAKPQPPVLQPGGVVKAPMSEGPARQQEGYPEAGNHIAVYPLESWIEVPAAIIHRAEIADLTSYLFNPYTGVGSRSWLPLMLKLTPLEWESVNNLLVTSIFEWSDVAQNFVIKNDSGGWNVKIPPEERKNLRDKLVREITTLLGPEKSYFFQATTYQSLQKLYGGERLELKRQEATGEWTLGYQDGSGSGFRESSLDNGAPMGFLITKIKLE